MAGKVQLKPTPDQLVAEDTTWLHLGDLRELVKKADELGWSDRALVSHSIGTEHPKLSGVRIARYLVVEGPA